MFLGQPQRENQHKKTTFYQAAILPAFMFLCDLVIFFYFRARGGDKPVELD
jgi:hypothetical protein